VNQFKALLPKSKKRDCKTFITAKIRKGKAKDKLYKFISSRTPKEK